MMKAVAIVSGGLDSTTMLYYILQHVCEPDEVLALTFNYGQKHLIELQYARHTCEKLGVRQIELTLPMLPGSALTDADKQVPKLDYSVETQKLTVVPNRNMVFLSIAASYAIAHGAKQVCYAAHRNDEAVYPDCRIEFIRKLNAALLEGNYETVTVYAPFIHDSKVDIVTIGKWLGVPFEDTWSCYDPVKVDREVSLLNTHVHCGVCGTCRERRLAFEKAGVVDPTVYAEAMQ
jgi:7-cyano-7-deazaguanine synthase